VAYAVGFEDLSHFAKRFRVAYGAPPSQLSRSGKG
jgi:AraC-like DNA-binding protein